MSICSIYSYGDVCHTTTPNWKLLENNLQSGSIVQINCSNLFKYMWNHVGDGSNHEYCNSWFNPPPTFGQFWFFDDYISQMSSHATKITQYAMIMCLIYVGSISTMIYVLDLLNFHDIVRTTFPSILSGCIKLINHCIGFQEPTSTQWKVNTSISMQLYCVAYVAFGTTKNHGPCKKL